MTPVVVILLLIVLVNSLFALRFLSDVIKHRATLHAETGSPLYLAISAPIIFFLSALGISDFAVSTILYRMKKVVSDEKLPGTLNTQCVIPVAVMAFAFISVIQVDIVTLVVCIMAQVIGAYFGPRLVVKLEAKTIRKFISMGLLMAAVFIVASKFNWLPAGGTAVGLSGTKLGIAALCFCFFGIVNNIGIGTFPLGMATVYALGMNPAVAFPILMGAATFSIPIGSMEFIKYGQYSRKITLYTAIFGVLGVLVGVSLVKELEISMLQSLVAVILLYSGISMLMQEFKAAKAESKALSLEH